MNLTELQAEVYTLTNRPDLVAQTLAGIKASTLRLHTISNFYWDIKSFLLKFDATGYIQTIDARVLPRLRNMSYIRKYDPSLAAYQQDPLLSPSPLIGGINPSCLLDFLTLTTPDNALDSYGYEKTNVYYQAGDTIFVKSATSLLYCLLGYYQFPCLIDEAYQSWIAEKFPYAIVYEVVGNILATTGNNDSAAKYLSRNPQNPGLAMQWENLLTQNATIVEGY